MQSRSDCFLLETYCFPLETQNALSIADNQFDYHTMNKEFPGIKCLGVENPKVVTTTGLHEMDLGADPAQFPPVAAIHYTLLSMMLDPNILDHRRSPCGKCSRAHILHPSDGLQYSTRLLQLGPLFASL